MIELACTADRVYLKHTVVMLHSALVSTPGSRFRVYVQHGGDLIESDFERLRAMTDALGAEIIPVEVAVQNMTGLPAKHFHQSCWYRVLLPELLPSVDKVLYLDSDIIVTDSLCPLWETDISSHLLAGVTNPLYPFMPNWPRAELGLNSPREYINSGVLLLNLERWRLEGAVEKVRCYAQAHPDNKYPEQDALNALFHGETLLLHPRWNVQTTYYDLELAQLPVPAEQVKQALAHPAAIHFIGPFKPWQYLCTHPLRQLYFEHARATPWGEPALEGRSVRNAVLRRFPLAWIVRWFKVEQAARWLWRRAR